MRLWIGLGLLAAASNVSATGPSFSCEAVRAGSIEAMICEDERLADLDRQLAEAYKAAVAVAHDEQPPMLKAEQRGWIKGRNDCWKSDTPRDCVEKQYGYRIIELQARYRLVPHTGPVTYACDGDPRNEVVATYFRTEPASLIAERGDSVSFMVRVRTASGARYDGPNEWLWEHQGKATIVWGYEAPEMRCVKRDGA